jgi:phage gp29-like protein
VGAKDGNPYGLGLGSSLFWPALFKKMDITFWLTFNDKFGSPTAVGKYPQSAQQPEIDRLLDVLSAIAQDAGVTIPENMMIEYLEAARAGSVDAYERMARYMDEQISITVLGETLSTNVVGTGARAASETHNDVRLELTQADGEALAETINGSLVKWDVEFNMPGAKPPLLSWETEAGEDLNDRVERDQIIYGMGFKPSLQYINETYGGEWTEREMTAPPPGDGTGDAEPDPAFAEIIKRALTPRGETTADKFAARLAKEGADPIEAMVQQVRLLFAECGSLEEARDRLLEIFPKMDAKGFAGVMERALTAVDLAGRYEAK